jgi:hypothetical protein
MRRALPILSHKARPKPSSKERVNQPRNPARDHQREEGSACVAQDRGCATEALYPNHVTRCLVPDQERVTRPVMSEALNRLRPVSNPMLQRGSSRTPMQDVRWSRLDSDQEWRHPA